MCGRYTLFADVRFIEDEFGIRILDESVIPKNYNVAPTTFMPVIRNGDDGKPDLASMKWGLIPSWSENDKMAFGTINARAESLQEKPAFREPFKRRRCIVPASGFYEWMTRGKRKFPYFIFTPRKKVVGYAGLYDTWRAPNGSLVESFTIVTTGANKTVKPLHDRMPVILEPRDYTLWLNAGSHDDALKTLFKSYPDEEMSAYPVSEAVNAVKNNRHDLILKTEHQKDLFD
jgi:putative SOS response-associated peptidase YedK